MKGMKLRLILAASVVSLVTAGPGFAQEAVTGAADPDALFHSKDKKLDANKQVAYHIMLDLLECNHWEEAGKWLTNEYHQHNPNVVSGLEPVVKFFGNNPNRPKKANCTKLETTKVVAVVADGDLVTVITPRTYKDSKGQSYTSTWFDTWRIKNGKADEHWDNALKP